MAQTSWTCKRSLTILISLFSMLKHRWWSACSFLSFQYWYAQYSYVGNIWYAKRNYLIIIHRLMRKKTVNKQDKSRQLKEINLLLEMEFGKASPKDSKAFTIIYRNRHHWQHKTATKIPLKLLWLVQEESGVMQSILIQFITFSTIQMFQKIPTF